MSRHRAMLPPCTPATPLLSREGVGGSSLGLNSATAAPSGGIWVLLPSGGIWVPSGESAPNRGAGVLLPGGRARVPSGTSAPNRGAGALLPSGGKCVPAIVQPAKDCILEKETSGIYPRRPPLPVQAAVLARGGGSAAAIRPPAQPAAVLPVQAAQQQAGEEQARGQRGLKARHCSAASPAAFPAAQDQ